MKSKSIFQVTLVHENDGLIVESYYTASDIRYVIHALALDFEDEATDVISIRKLAPLLADLK